MANFQTHISFSTVLGVGYGGAACLLFDVPVPAAILAGGLCSVSGMLPDVDSNAGVPLRESMGLAAAVIPLMLIDRGHQCDMAPETIVLTGAAIYLLIRFGVAKLLRTYTVHRGMFHSLPAAVIFGQLAFLLSPGEDLRLRVFQAGAVVIGYLSHLLLDELYSVEWHHGRLRLKRTFGTALKLFGQKWWPTVFAYLQLIVLTYVVINEPAWTQQGLAEHVKPTIHEASHAVDRLLR